MKLLILPVILLLGNSCTSRLVSHEFVLANTNRSYPVSKMNSLEGGITENNNFIISRMSNLKNYTYIIDGETFRFAQIQKDYENYSISHIVTEKIKRYIPIYTIDQKPKENEEYLKIKSFDKYIINLQYNDPENKLHTIVVNNSYSADPYFLKRTAFAIATPFAVALDIVITCIPDGGHLHNSDKPKSKNWIHD